MGRPAQAWQSRPYFHEGGCSREEFSVPSADVKAFHRPQLGEAIGNQSLRLRDVNEAERTRMVLTTIVPDLCPAERAGTVKINRRSCGLSFHLYPLKTETSIDQHGCFMDVGQILDLLNKELSDICPRNDPVPPL